MQRIWVQRRKWLRHPAHGLNDIRIFLHFSLSFAQQQKGLHSLKLWLYDTSNNTSCLCYQLSGLGGQWRPASRPQTVHVDKPRQFLLMFTEIKTVPS